jgi:hypothetical protein
MYRSRHLASACALLFICPALRAQEQCGVEVKLLLAPEAIQAAIPALGAKHKSLTHIYFFDTDRLELLSQGVILRLRTGVEAELTVKIRHPQGKAFSDPSGGHEKFKCEVDFVGGGGIPSYSLQSSYAERQVPDTGEGLFQSLSDPQKELLKEAQVSIDWSRVRRIADIQSTAWRSKSVPGFDKLELELWQFSGGQVLELSTRGASGEGPSIADALRKLAGSTGLSLNSSQLPKTSTVLQELTHATVH